MIQVYKKNNLFIIEDTCRDVIYPNLTKDEAVVKLKEFNRESDRVDYPITDIKEDEFKYSSLEVNEASIIHNNEIKDSEKIVIVTEELLKELKDTYDLLNSYKNALNKDKTIEELKQQLAEKDEEIDTLHKTILRLSNEKERIQDRLNIDYLLFTKQIHHQMCKEIREWCQNNWDYDDFMYFLDKIEKGE